MRRWIPVAAVTTVVALALAGAAEVYQPWDDGTGSVAVTPPPGPHAGDGSRSVAVECDGMIHALPATIDGRAARKTTPDSLQTAAWGNPAIKLRCGVPQPAVLDISSPAYDAQTAIDAPAQWIGGVSWVGVKGDGGYTFTTISRNVYIEVWCPLKGDNGINTTDPLIDFAPAIIARTQRADGAGTGPDPQTKTY